MTRAPETSSRKAKGKKAKSKDKASTDKRQVPLIPPQPLPPRFLDVFETDWVDGTSVMSLNGPLDPNDSLSEDADLAVTTGHVSNQREIQMLEFLKRTALLDCQALCTAILVVEEWDWRYHNDQIGGNGAEAQLRGPDRLIQYLATAAAALDGIDLDEITSDVAPRRRMRDWLIITKKIRRPWENRTSLLAAPVGSVAPALPSGIQHLIASPGCLGRKPRVRNLNPKELKALIFLREIIHRRLQLENKGIMSIEAFETPERRGKLWDWAFNCFDALLRTSQYQRRVEPTGILHWRD